MTEEEIKPAGSHHGDPDLLNRDIRLLEAHSLWVCTVRAAKAGNDDWLPRHVDWIKSRLFWRIRSGKEPLKYPPPTCYSCPWYELIEDGGPHTCFEEIRISDDEGKKLAYVAQCRYQVIEEDSMEDEEHAAKLQFGHYKFKAWNALVTYSNYKTGESSTRMNGHIRYLGAE